MLLPVDTGGVRTAGQCLSVRTKGSSKLISLRFGTGAEKGEWKGKRERLAAQRRVVTVLGNAGSTE